MKRCALTLLLVGCSSSSPVPAAEDAAPAEVASDAAPSCTMAVDGIAVGSTDPYAYPPYAIDGCRLAYLASDGTLHLRDFALGDDIVVDGDSPSRPTLAGDTLAWEAKVAGKTVVRVRQGGKVATLDHAGEPRAANDAVVFTRWTTDDANGDTDVLLYVPSTGTTTPVADGPGQQRFADVSEAFVAVSDFSEDPDGRFDGNETDLADVAVFDRTTGKLTVRKKSGKQAFPILAGGTTLVYHDWAAIHPQPKLEAYALLRTKVGAPVTSDITLAEVQTLPPYTRPSGRGGVVEWVVRDEMGRVTLHRATEGGAEQQVFESLDLYAPATGVERTVIATRSAENPKAMLRVIPR